MTLFEHENTGPYDVAIIGAGLAGLAAAHALRDRNIIVLEKEPRPGGRVYTKSAGESFYDLGAVFAYDPAAAPIALRTPALHHESERIGLFAQGNVHYGTSVRECLRQLDLAPHELDTLDAFESDPEKDASTLLPGAYRHLNSFFRLIHPGDMREYLPQRQHDAFIKFPTRHYETANGSLVEGLARPLEGRLETGVEVLSLTEKGGSVEVIFRRGEETHTLAARAVVCTAPAPVARRLVTTLTNDRCRVFLDSLRYGEGTVVVLGLEGADLADFSYIVTPDLPFNTVIKHRGRDGKPDTLFVYYVGEASEALSGLPHEEIVRRTLEHARALKVGALSEKTLRFADVHRWATVGPRISPASYADWTDWEARACERIFLAGDYVFVEPDNVLPFGTTQALQSGKRAAESVRAYLDVPAEVEAFRSQTLIETTIYRLAGERPAFVQTKSECNISYYGLLLQANPSRPLTEYLLQSARESLWEYQVGFGVTADDSLLVLEGLLAAGVGRDVLQPKLDRLVELFYSRPQGAFHSLSERRAEIKGCAQGLADYWLGPSVYVSAHAGHLLHRVAPERYPQEVGACTQYVAGLQEPEGYWSSIWFSSKFVTTLHAAKLLGIHGERYRPQLWRATAFILATQGHDGSWGETVLETSAAVLALEALGEAGTAALRKAKSWLRARKKPDGWEGEPMLYYWFETGPAEKMFFHCRDRGAVTSAWATLALANPA
ncbi:FAD-dependent oxidoreductase [Sorangium sp. So ce295]|uniref:FAD-dependent oxidoreductase n=1 Tax=Sorangium sp. So ce295 TaxID=3133295 RepID=UPI003F61C67B